MDKLRVAIGQYTLSEQRGEPDKKWLEIANESQEWIFKFMQPPRLQLHKADNELTQIDRDFSQLCTWLQTEGIVQPERLSVYDLEQRLIFFQKRYAKQNRKNNS